MTNFLKSGRTINPFFYIGIDIPDKYFCDREAETKQLSDLILSNNNVVLKASRRLGKSSLIFHLFNQKPFKKEFNTIYVDIYPTKSDEDFVAAFYKAIAECTSIRNKSDLEDMNRKLKEVTVSAEMSFPNTLKLSGSRQYETYKVDKTLDVLFDFLSKTSKPNLVVIDEFQQIRCYQDSNLEAALRSYVQRSNNCNFIFSGSSRHMLTQIFESSDKPFYRSSRPFNLGLISEDKYAEFCKKQFSSYDKSIDEAAIHLVYTLAMGNTFIMQQTMNCLFNITPQYETAAIEDAKYAFELLIDEKSEDYKAFMHRLKPNYENVLRCIAAEGIAEDLFSEAMKAKYNLPASSTVSNILKSFQREDSRVVEEIVPGVYQLEDKFLELWAVKYLFNSLDAKFAMAEAIFGRWQQLRSKI